MNIVCYINKNAKGGAERVMSLLANGLSGRGHKVFLVTDYLMKNEYFVGDTVKRISFDEHVDRIGYGNKLIRNIHRIIGLRKFCREENIDIIISFIRDANERALLATRGLKTKNIISVRIDPLRAYSTKYKALKYKSLYKLADGCVFQTEEAKEFYPRSVQRKARVIYNPVSEQFFRKDGFVGKQKTVVTCGRLEKQKNFELLIRAFGEASGSIPEYRLNIFGEGKQRRYLEELVKELKLEDKVFLMGRSNNVAEEIKDASLFVLSSDYEGLPNALMEAMALGLPVIATDFGGGGARVLITDHMDGIIVPCSDIKALSEQIVYCLNNYGIALQLGIHAREKAEKSFTENMVLDEWENYLSLVVSAV